MFAGSWDYWGCYRIACIHMYPPTYLPSVHSISVECTNSIARPADLKGLYLVVISVEYLRQSNGIRLPTLPATVRKRAML